MKKSAILFAVFVLSLVLFAYVVDFTGALKSDKPWHLQPFVHEDSLSQIYKDHYRIFERNGLYSLQGDSTSRRVFVLIDSWGVPNDESLLLEDLSIFSNGSYVLGLHRRMANRTKHAESVEYRGGTGGGTFLFGGDSAEYNRRSYLSERGFNEFLFCQNCNDLIMITKLDSVLSQGLCRTYALTTQDSRYGDRNRLHNTLKAILNVALKHPDVEFIVQGAHRPILGDPNVRRKYRAHWVPVVVVNPRGDQWK